MQPLEERVVPYATRLSEEAKTLSPGTVREAIEQAETNVRLSE